MRRVIVMMAAAIIVMGTASQAQAQIIRFTATLDGSKETPPVLTGSPVHLLPRRWT
jgi:hypothetical protein